MGTALANAPEVQNFGSAIYPVGSRDIQLVSEVVDIRLRDAPSNNDEAQPNATCTYQLRNLADSTRHVSMAFVLGGPVSDFPDEPRWRVAGRAFRVTQDGEPRAVRFMLDSLHVFRDDFSADADSFPAWDVVIPPLATTTVAMVYSVYWGGGCEDECWSYFRYHARPAALWAGRIERASFRLHLGDEAFVRRLRRPGAPWSVGAEPSGYRWMADGVSWEFRNWEPDSDLVVEVRFPGTTAYDGDLAWSPWAPDSLAAMPPVTTGLDRVPEVVSGDCAAYLAACRETPTKERRPWAFRLRAHVMANGRCDQVRYPDPPDEVITDNGKWCRLNKAAACVGQWRFRPAMKAGRAVDAWIDLRMEAAGGE